MVALSLKFASKDIRIIVASPRKYLTYSRLSKYFDQYIYISKDSYLSGITKIIREYQVDFIYPTDELGTAFILNHHHDISSLCQIIPIPDELSFNISRDKWKLHSFLKKADNSIPLPETILYNKYTEAPIFKYPFILKPARGGGGRFIYKIKDQEQLRSFNAHVDTKSRYIMQKYIDGHDIGCSVLCKNGNILAHSIQKTTSKNFDSQYDVRIYYHDEEVLDIVSRVMKPLNWNGIAHLDFVYNNLTKEKQLLEINPRFWGSMFGSLSTGLNFSKLLLNLANGEEITPPLYDEYYYVQTRKWIKDILKGKRKYKLSQSSIRYKLADPLVSLATLIKRP